MLANKASLISSRRCPTISHLLFANDSLLFCRTKEVEGLAVKSILKTYEHTSSQFVNFSKSSILFKDVKKYE